MKILIKPIAVILIGVYSFALGQDVYPYFKDSKKQVEFEEKKIFVKEVDEKELILSGGSQMNFLYLFDQNQPAIVPGDINTSYIYRYSFEMIQNGRTLTEIELLDIIGLEEKANEIRNDINNNLKRYYEELAQYQKAFKEYEANLSIAQEYNLFLVPAALFYAVGYVGTIYGLVQAMDNKDFEPITIGIISLGITFWFIELDQSLNDNNPKPNEPIKTVLQQKYTNEQLESLSESYNKRIYEEIENAN